MGAQRRRGSRGCKGDWVAMLFWAGLVAGRRCRNKCQTVFTVSIFDLSPSFFTGGGGGGEGLNVHLNRIERSPSAFPLAHRSAFRWEGEICRQLFVLGDSQRLPFSAHGPMAPHGVEAEPQSAPNHAPVSGSSRDNSECEEARWRRRCEVNRAGAV